MRAAVSKRESISAFSSLAESQAFEVAMIVKRNLYHTQGMNLFGRA